MILSRVGNVLSVLSQGFRNWVGQLTELNKRNGVLVALALGLWSGCAASPSDRNTFRKEGVEVDAPLVQAPLKLSSDRKALEEIRQRIGEDQRQANDELALILKDLSGDKPNFSRARERFEREARRARAAFQKNLEVERKEFTRAERKNKADFLAELERERRDSLTSRISREDRSRFFQDQDGKRREYFARERERSADFESDVRERRRNFDEYLKDQREKFKDAYQAAVLKEKEIERQTKKLQQEQELLRQKREGE